MARTYTVKKCQKAQGNCQSCGKPIEVGMAYKYVKPQRGVIYKRHQDCPSWRASELTSSAQLATLYGGQEAAHDNLDHLLENTSYDESFDPAQFISDVEQIVHDCAEAADEGKEMYEESLQNLPDNFQDGSDMNDKIAECETWHDELEQWSWDGDDAPDLSNVDEEDPDREQEYENARQEWASMVCDGAREPIDSLGL